MCAAASSLANFECDLALAGGVAWRSPHDSRLPVPAGRHRSARRRVPGLRRRRARRSLLGNGVGVVALRRLSDALADGDQVYAVIRGWAVNNDAGRKVGFTAPGVERPGRGDRRGAGGGRLGAARTSTTSRRTAPAPRSATPPRSPPSTGLPRREPCCDRLHQDQRRPPRPGRRRHRADQGGAVAAPRGDPADAQPARRPTRNSPPATAKLSVVTSTHPWPRGDRRAEPGVSAFGIGGTNAHVIVEEAPVVAREPSPRQELLVWSARSAKAADETTANLAAHLDTMDRRTPRSAPASRTSRTPCKAGAGSSPTGAPWSPTR